MGAPPFYDGVPGAPGSLQLWRAPKVNPPPFTFEQKAPRGPKPISTLEGTRVLGPRGPGGPFIIGGPKGPSDPPRRFLVLWDPWGPRTPLGGTRVLGPMGSGGLSIIGGPEGPGDPPRRFLVVWGPRGPKNPLKPRIFQ